MIELLPDRSVLAITGTDRTSFLQGLVTNDLTSLTENRCIWSALLTAQGRWLSEFFLYSTSSEILMDCPSSHAEMLIKHLSRFRLRAYVQIKLTDFLVIVGHDAPPPKDIILTASDPRLPNAGWRAILPQDQSPSIPSNTTQWIKHRLNLGLPDYVDFISEKTLPLEANMDLLHGVSWSKGCYMGQELTARTHYRGLLKRRLLPVTLTEGHFPEAGGTLMIADKEVGDIRTRSGNQALALLRKEAWDAPNLTYNETPVSVLWPEWFPLEMRS
ncbi:CAF17-like 4Fe-4S cluster assembly/insertion protein YgfZ [Swingsia samuiensis]|uniref:Folate-binding protein n=1 Tax=Swingsia samuiensis TaxID=1293412 RepID=A0A4Y6ULZ0_9PROT|nr:folate-binding protein YgfZ [Swingsia samuiensis]QDH17688.1 folate-binding protein [Swingsia samuiensis]